MVISIGLPLIAVLFVLFVQSDTDAIGTLAIAFLGLFGIFYLFVPRTILWADARGIMLALSLAQKRKPIFIPWAEIKNIDAATMTVPTTFGSATERFLAIYLNNPSYLTRSKAGKVGQAIARLMGSAFVDDEGAAQVYIMASQLPGRSVEKVAEQLNAKRPLR